MSAEAIARLRVAVSRYHSDEQFRPELEEVEHDLRALLDAHAALEAEFKTRAGEWADAQRVFAATEAAHTEALDALERLRAEPKLWKRGAGGQDQYAGLPPAMRVIDAVLAKAGRR